MTHLVTVTAGCTVNGIDYTADVETTREAWDSDPEMVEAAARAARDRLRHHLVYAGPRLSRTAARCIADDAPVTTHYDTGAHRP